MIKLKKRESMNDVINSLDLSEEGVPIPDTNAKLVDYNFENNNYRLIIERSGKFKEIMMPCHASLSSLTTAVQKLNDQHSFH